jgi:hypothetical protein
MRCNLLASCLIVALIAGAPLIVSGQNHETAAGLYVEGVYAYFAGQSQRADSYLTQSIAGNPNDPRAFYFRGLSRVREGRQSEARADMQTGAALEARHPNYFDVGKTLERVQGPTRLALEEYRRSARIKAGLNPPLGPLKQIDTGVLRERYVVPLEEFSHSGVPRAVAVPDAVDVGPSKAAAGPVNTVAPNAASNPFNDDANMAPAAKSAAAVVPPQTPAATATPPATPTPVEAPVPPQSKEAPQPTTEPENPF